MMGRGTVAALLAAVSCCGAAFGADTVFEDFEGKDYGDWKAVGGAFGTGPARGTLDQQMEVSGYKGKRLVNSFHQGDGATGTLTSPEFTIERPHISFLIGGGKHPGETCINLLVGGEAVRTATGPNDKPGGSERLRWQSWDVRELAGKKAVIQIVDSRTDGWGHVNVDHIVFGDEPMTSERKREITVEKSLLNLPVKNGAPKAVLRLLRGAEILREYEIELAEKEPDFWAAVDIAPYKGETLTLWSDGLESDDALNLITPGESLIGGENLYQEELRPQFHFSPQRGWNNDPNGLVWHAGEYHLFFQHNPVGWNWGNMTWGHAVSRDLVRWTELGDAIHPDALGTVFSGSAVVDHANTTGFQTGDEPPLVCVYTAAGGTGRWSENAPFTQALAYSNDRGRTWTKHGGNPVQGHIVGGNRDPKAFWHEPSGCWVIVLFLDGKRMGIFNSPDLKTWTLQSELESFFECPELFELPVDGDKAKTKWVLYGASGEYFTGAFDGKVFTPDGPALPFNFGNCFYASQTYNNIPAEDGRRIQIAWGTVGDKSMPFNQMMDFPVELTLRSTPEGPRLCAWPVREIASLYARESRWTGAVPGGELPVAVTGDCLDIEAVFDAADARRVGFAVRGVKVAYDVETGELTCGDKTAKVALEDGKLALRLLVDRMSIEAFAQNGLVYMPMGVHFDEDNLKLDFVKGANAHIESLAVRSLKSAWPR
ncbi:MAG TPA: glycoside hydrolase family 32 protein [Candidatus Hydrogenedentes bacterium]|nr:glycoside hydrolase family 32 protein [Candidatus Hydrogenedentota bacterium]HOH51991.1 glycoside hydrolase family 32 protein [Candidatus Hydrogenedentota bacterium]